MPLCLFFTLLLPINLRILEGTRYDLCTGGCDCCAELFGEEGDVENY